MSINATDGNTVPNEGFVKILMHNDDVSTMDFVSTILEGVFEMSPEDARKTTIAIHRNGYSVVGEYKPELALRKVGAVHKLGRMQGFPLRCSIDDGSESTTKEKTAGANASPSVSSQTDGYFEVPSGWQVWGPGRREYKAGIDTNESHSGDRCGFIQNAVSSPRQFGTLMQSFSPDEFLDKRLRMTMWVKTDSPAGKVQPWMRIDGAERKKSLAFDNSCDRPIEGKNDWQVCHVVLDVPAESTNIAFGIMLTGEGTAWIDDVSFDVVGADIQTTNCPCHLRVKRGSPVNLKFAE